MLVSAVAANAYCALKYVRSPPPDAFTASGGNKCSPGRCCPAPLPTPVLKLVHQRLACHAQWRTSINEHFRNGTGLAVQPAWFPEDLAIAVCAGCACAG